MKKRGMFLIRFVGIGLFFALASLAQAATVSFVASGNWTAPAGVTTATVEAWGGGGGGGAATGNPAKGGGGAGGQYARKVVTVIPGNNYAIVVGAGGTVSATTAGNPGGDSTFATATVVAKGGAGGGLAAANNSGGTAGAGSPVGGVGDVVYAGGSGSAGISSGTGGAGGGGAGSSGAGGNASGNTAGTGTATGGGNGGAGLVAGAEANGNAGSLAGGGGSGGNATDNTNHSGGAGEDGQVMITYAAPPVLTTDPATSLTSTGATLNGTVTSNDAATTVTFEYGLTLAYGSTVTATGSPLAAGAPATAVLAAVTGLTPNTLYHFRVKGVNSAGTTNGADRTFTTAALPSVLSINRASVDPTVAATSVSWTVVFSSGVTSVDATDFVLVQAGGASGATITPPVTGSGTTWTVTANTGMVTAGTLGLNLVDDDSIIDAGSSKLGGTGAGNGDFTGQVYTLRYMVGGVVNTYYPGTTASVAVGATSITLGAATGSATPIATGDLLLIMQMQDATINAANSNLYGDGAAGDPGSGATTPGASGVYEYVIAGSAVPLAGGTLTLCSTATVNAYSNAAFVAGSSGQKRYQVIRVPVYASGTLTSTTTALAWNGSTGGVLAFDVTGLLTLNSATVSVDGMGFRGGAGRGSMTGSGTNTDYRTLATNLANGSKGEGIAGTPRYVLTAPSTSTDTGFDGYPNGSFARGAPGNAGGGGTDRNPAANDENPGGGGGANGGAGGIGGIGWCGAFTTTAPYYGCGLAAIASAANLAGSTGGFGGRPVSGLGANRLTLGGGGGAGTTNNSTGALGALSTSGAAGGGIVMIRAGSMTGSATVNANGSAGDASVENDGSGGGGGGGVVLINAGSGMGGVTINVRGGTGGSNLVPPNNTSTPHGPGGGGGGGYAITSAAGAACNNGGGSAGATYNSGVAAPFGAYGAGAGSAGSCATTLTSAQIPGAALGFSACGAGPNHYAISHSGTGITCEAEPVTITAHDGAHARASAAGKTINLTTSSAKGAWSAAADSCAQACYNASGVAVACGGTFAATGSNAGTATYLFGTGEAAVRLCLKHNTTGTVSVNVTDGTATEASGSALGEASPGADPGLVFSNTGWRFYADGSVDTLGDLVAGLRSDVSDATYQPAPQVLTIRALKTSETTPARCVSLLGSVTRTIQFAYQCIDPNTCQLPASGLEVNGTAVAGSGSVPTPASNVAVAFNAAGYGSINLKYWDVGQIKLYALGSVTDPTTGAAVSITTGASNTFLAKPYGFSVMACTGTAPCTTANTSAVDGTGTVFAAAGTTFNATVKAVAYGGTVVTPSFGLGTANGTESVALARTLVAPAGMCAGPSDCPGTLAGTTTILRSSFSSGIASVTDLAWNEVGVMTLTASNSTFAGLALSPVAAGVSGNIGRFTPHHFGLTGSVANRSDLAAPGGTFTYMDEPMRMTLLTTAYAAGDTVTQNYGGVFAKLVTGASGLDTGSNWFNTGCSGATQCFGLGAVDGMTGLSGRLGLRHSGSSPASADPTGVWSLGVGTFVAHVALARNATPDGPYETLKVGGMPRDSDSVTLPGTASSDAHKIDLDATADGVDERKLIFQTRSRFGRLWLGNAFGSDRSALSIPYQYQYWNGSAFIRNPDDSLSSFASTNLGLGNYQGTITSTNMAIAKFIVGGNVGGVGSIAAAAPTAAAAGSVDVVVDLGASSTTNNAWAPVLPAGGPAGANLSYLRGKWYGSAYDRDPTCRATFGIFGSSLKKGPIYIRENF